MAEGVGTCVCVGVFCLFNPSLCVSTSQGLQGASSAQGKEDMGLPQPHGACRGRLVYREKGMCGSWPVEGGLWPEESGLSCSRKEPDRTRKMVNREQGKARRNSGGGP